MREVIPMPVRQALAVARSEVRYLTRTGALWKLIGIHCALLVAALLLSWPPRERLASASPPFVLKWLLMTHLAALAYASLLLAADGVAWGEADRPRPVHWVAYGACPPWAAVAGRILSLWHVLALLTGTGLPLLVLAHGASPVPMATLGAWSAVALATLTLIGLIGLGIGCISAERATRLVGVDALALGVTALLFLLGSRGERPDDGLLFYLNPARVLSFLLDPTAPGGQTPFSWPLWLGLYTALTLAATLFVIRGLRAWRRRSPPGPGGGAPRADARMAGPEVSP